MEHTASTLWNILPATTDNDDADHTPLLVPTHENTNTPDSPTHDTEQPQHSESEQQDELSLEQSLQEDSYKQVSIGPTPNSDFTAPDADYTDPNQYIEDEICEPEREVKDTETSALPTEATDQGVDGGDAGVVRLVKGEDELPNESHVSVAQGGAGRAENKRSSANPVAPRVENKRTRNGVPVSWDGAGITANNIVSQPHREKTKQGNFRSGAFLVIIPVPYRQATASGRFNESRFADIDKHLKLGAIVERHISEKPPGESLVPT
eukprot:g4440.t1